MQKGHNSQAAAQDTEAHRPNTGGVAGHILRSFIERVERLEEEKKALLEDIKDVYAEAKSSGFEPKIMRQIVRLRKMDGDKRAEQEALLDSYLHAIEGYQPDMLKEADAEADNAST